MSAGKTVIKANLSVIMKKYGNDNADRIMGNIKSVIPRTA